MSRREDSSFKCQTEMQCFSNFTAYKTSVSLQQEIILTFSLLKDAKRPTTNATNMKQARIFFAHIVLSHVFVCDNKDPPVVAVFLHIYRFLFFCQMPFLRLVTHA